MKNKGLLFALMAGMLWGFGGAVGQYTFSRFEISSGWVSMTRMIVSGIILLGISLFSKDKESVQVWKVKKDGLHLLVFAVFGLMLYQYTYLTAISHSNSATATALQYVGQTLILIVSCVMSKRLPKIMECISILLAMGGILMISTHGNLHNLVMSGEALAWGLMSAVSMMLYTLLPGKLTHKYGSTVVNGYGMLIGGVVLGVSTGAWKESVDFCLELVLCLIFMIVFGTALAYSLYLQSVALIGGVKTSLYASVEIVSATFLAAVWLKTPFAWQDLVAIGMIFIMVILTSIDNSTGTRWGSIRESDEKSD